VCVGSDVVRRQAQYRALFAIYRALFIIYRALFIMYRALFTTYSTLFTIHIQGSFRNVKGSFHQFYSGPWRYLTQAQYRVLSQNIWLFSQYVGLFSSMLFRALTLSKFRRNTGLFSQNMGHVHKIKGSFTQCRALFTIYFITLCAGSVFM